MEIELTPSFHTEHVFKGLCMYQPTYLSLLLIQILRISLAKSNCLHHGIFNTFQQGVLLGI